jgi:pyruvate formate lyase activating enzyme
MTIEQILNEVESDRPFYENSGGGLTLSGGEPTSHADFADELLVAARARGLHTCLDTSGYCDWEVLERLIQNTDIVLFDLKHIDPASHRQMTGVSNEVILANLSRLAQTGLETWLRIPVIPDFNDSMDFHRRAAELLSGLPGGAARIDLLPFHNWCENKYEWLGFNWKLKDVEAVNPLALEPHADSYREKGFNVSIGGSGFENAVGMGAAGSV